MRWFTASTPLLLCLAGGCGGAPLAPAPPPAAQAPGTAHGGPPDASPDRELRAAILEQDRKMGVAYNAHDVARLMATFAPGLEFFHDTGGALDFAQVQAGFTSVFAGNPDIHRELLDGMEVFPIKGYGAIQIGTHRFCHTEHGKPVCGTFRFTQVWHESAGSWHISRVVSYGH
jgi:hypothetical protein